MKFVLIFVVSIVAAQIVYAQDGSKGKSTEHKPQNSGKFAEHKPQTADAIHRFRRNPMPQNAQASGGFQVTVGGQAGYQIGGKLGQMIGQAKQMAAQMICKAKQMGAQIKNKLQQLGGQGQINGQITVNG